MPDDKEQLKTEIMREVEAMIDEAIKNHTHNGLDALFVKGSSFQNAPYTKIADPSGGSPIDSEARTAINAILDILEDTGLMLDN